VRFCHVQVGERQREKGRRRRRGNHADGRNRRTRTRKDISNNILRAREVAKLLFFSSSAGVSPCISLKIKKRHYEHHMIETHR
jgi:hypothetical protein